MKRDGISNQFTLHHLVIDSKRGTITNEDFEQKVEPRAMDVLLYLAKHPHQVISQQELFDNIWPDTLFSPGAVQRCIAILRKAMGHDSKAANFIVTHPKRGYSLDVEPKPVGSTKSGLSDKIPLLFVIVIILFFSYYLINSTSSPTYEGKLTAITSSSNYDFYPVPGLITKDISFIRQFPDGSHIWSINTESKRQQQLSKRSGDYRSISWDRPNKRLYFVEQTVAGSLVGSLDFSQSEVKQESFFSLEGNGNIWRALPHKNNIYYLLANVPTNQTPETQLSVFNRSSQQHEILLSSNEEFTPYRITLSPDQSTIAIAGEAQGNQVEIRLFDLNSNLLSAAIQTLPLGFTEISWHPDGHHLLVHHMNKLHLLNLDGTSLPVPYQHYQRIHNPHFNSDGTQLLLSASRQDSDIWRYDLEKKQMDKSVDSTGEDHLGRLAPNGYDLAFVSNRSGQQQVFLRTQGNEMLIFANTDNQPIYRAPIWSQDGKKLAFAAENTLHIYEISNDTLTQYQLPPEFTAALDWYQDESALLVAVKQNNNSFFAKWSFDDMKISIVQKTGVNFFARLNNEDQLVFHNSKSVVKNGEKTELLQTPSNRRVFPVKEQIIYQSAGQVLSQHDSKLSVLLSELPFENAELIDVSQDGKHLLFVHYERQSAQIIGLH